MSAKLYEPGEVAAALQVDGSTVRCYCDEFAEFQGAKTSADDGRGLTRCFTERDLAVLREARQMLDQPRRPTHEHVRTFLRQKYDQSHSVDTVIREVAIGAHGTTVLEGTDTRPAAIPQTAFVAEASMSLAAGAVSALVAEHLNSLIQDITTYYHAHANLVAEHRALL